MMRVRGFAVLLGLLILASCTGETEGEEFPPIEIIDVDIPDVSFVEEEDVGDQECEVVYELPPGESYALQVTSFHEPSAIAGLVRGYLSDIPPLLLFADGLSDGAADDPVDVVGGIGERIGFGFDDTPDTENDVYTLHFGSIDPERCEFQVQLSGNTDDLHLEAVSPLIHLNLDGLSSITEGLSLEIQDVTVTGDFDAELGLLEDVLLSGTLSDDGLEALLDAARDYIPLSREQAMELLDPDETGVILIEIGLEGRKIVVEGFSDPWNEVPVEPRVEEPCCPDGLEVGDSVLPHLSWERQGLQEDQLELFQMALPELRSDTNVAMITTARRQADGEIHYYVYSGGAVDEGRVVFRRTAGDGGRAPGFEIVESIGVNPLANNDPTALSDYEVFLETGINPNDISYAEQGYGAGDLRLGFVPASEMHYPFAFERISQNFDDPRTGDFIIIPASWATGGFGTHGHLGALQSRSPLLVSGPGVRTAAEPEGDFYTVEDTGDGQTLMVEKAVRQVDIAPTVAAALGVSKTTGVGPDMRLRDDVYLGWQDGRVLREIFTDEALAKIENGEPVAERAVIIVNDGLTNTELLYQTLSDDAAFDVDSYQRIFQRGLVYRYGSISNFPSNTYPGHNALGSGAWAGHHGIIDNTFRVREQGVDASPIREIFETEYLLGSAHANLPVETLHEAVVRTFGTLDEGNLTASINEPSTRGAEFATLERRLPGGFQLSDSADEVQVGDETYPLPRADLQDYAGVMDNGSLQTFAELYQDHINRGEEGLPIPRYTIVNFGSTDSAGHAHGPHGDHERYTVISRVNQRMGTMLDLLEYLELDDSTMVILTSDHGMELQDESRSFWRARALATAEVSVRQAGWYYYLKQLDFEIADKVEEAQDVRLTLRVTDRDSRDNEERVGVADVMVNVVNGGVAEEVYTDDEGYVELVVTPDDGATEILVDFDSPDWNGGREWVGL